MKIGIGFKEMVERYKKEGREEILKKEKGIIDFGEEKKKGEEEWDMINEGKKDVKMKKGEELLKNEESF